MAQRKVTQVDNLFSTTVTPGSTFIFTLSDELEPEFQRGATLIRTLLDITLAPSSPGGVEGEQRVDMGIGIFTQQQITTGSSAIADISVETARPILPWLWRTRGYLTDTVEGRGHLWRIQADVRSMRKLNMGTCALVGEPNVHTGVTFTPTVVGICRQWYKLA